MDDLSPQVPSPPEFERRITDGWSALEQGDIEGARAALRDAHAADPTHPALPLLAAEIRRARQKRIPWRAAMLLVVGIALGAFGVRWWSGVRRVPPSQSTPTTTSVPAVKPSDSVPAAPATETGTAGGVHRPASPPPKPEVPPAQRRVVPPTPMDDDAVIRQAIGRFENAYRSRWAPLRFRGCEITRELDSATATCRARPTAEGPDANFERVWTFSLRKADGVWKIVSVQPPQS